MSNKTLLAGGAVAACAVCCAVPVLGLMGAAGVGITTTSFLFGGLKVALVVGTVSLIGWFMWRRSARGGDGSAES